MKYKYIRTKDKIEKVPDDYANKLIECHSLKIADTIEELINRYVVRKTMYKIYTKLQFEKLSMNKVRDMLSKGYEIYGAIWTDKGLIYVTKMNEKGELELI